MSAGTIRFRAPAGQRHVLLKAVPHRQLQGASTSSLRCRRPRYLVIDPLMHVQLLQEGSKELATSGWVGEPPCLPDPLDGNREHGMAPIHITVRILSRSSTS